MFWISHPTTVIPLCNECTFNTTFDVTITGLGRLEREKDRNREKERERERLDFRIIHILIFKQIRIKKNVSGDDLNIKLSFITFYLMCYQRIFRLCMVPKYLRYTTAYIFIETLMGMYAQAV